MHGMHGKDLNLFIYFLRINIRNWYGSECQLFLKAWTTVRRLFLPVAPLHHYHLYTFRETKNLFLPHAVEQRFVDTLWVLRIVESKTKIAGYPRSVILWARIKTPFIDQFTPCTTTLSIERLIPRIPNKGIQSDVLLLYTVCIHLDIYIYT